MHTLLLLEVKLDFFERMLRGLMALICKFIYRVIAWSYNIFIEVGTFELLTSEEVRGIYSRVSLILTTIMAFYITFEFVKYIIEPDNMTDKEKGVGKLTKRLFVVIVLLAFVPNIFTFAYKVQGTIIESSLLEKIILGKTDTNATSYGNHFSSSVLSLFYSYPGEYGDEECDGVDCRLIVDTNIYTLNKTGKIPYITTGINSARKNNEVDAIIEGEKLKVKEAKINFDGFFAVAVGTFIAWTLILYCVDVGVRVIQLVYLQIIAPIPIIGYLSPKKDGIFQKWCKQCLTTYLDLFIRLSLIYFILLVCTTLLDSSTFDNLGEAGAWVKIALIMGLLKFAEKAPKMLQELFPSTGAASGNFGLKPGERIAPATAKLAGVALGTTKGLGSLARRGIRGFKKRNQLKEERKNNSLKDAKNNLNNSRKNYRKAQNASRKLATAERNQDEAYKRTMSAKKAFETEYQKNHKKAYKHGGRNENLTDEEEKLKANWDKEKSRFADSTKVKNQLRNDLGMKASAPLSAQRINKDKNIANIKENIEQMSGTYQAASGELTQAKQSYNEKEAARLSALEKVEQLKKDGKEGTPEYTTAIQELTSAENARNEAKDKMDVAEAKVNTERQKLVSKAKEYQQTYQQATDTQNKLEQEQRERYKKGEITLEAYEKNIGMNQQLGEIEKENSSKLTDLKNEVTLSEEKYTKAQNIASQSNVAGIITSSILGSMATTVKGIHQGAQAKTIGEAIEKTKKATEEDIKKIRATEKYYEDGGTGFIDRQTQTIFKKQGLPTRYEQVQSEVKSLSDKSKSIEALATMEGTAKAQVDAVEDRLKEKIEENHTIITEDGEMKTGVIDANGNEIKISVKKGQMHSEIISAEKAKLQTLEEAQTADSNRLAGLDPKSKEYAELKAIQEARSKKIIKQQDIIKLLPKYLARDQFTQIIRAENPLTEIVGVDKVAVEKWKDLETYLNTARTNPETVSKLKEILDLNLYELFRTGQYRSMTFDDVDKIKTALINISNARKRDVTQIKETQRQLESSSITDAAKAAEDFANNGGK